MNSSKAEQKSSFSSADVVPTIIEPFGDPKDELNDSWHVCCENSINDERSRDYKTLKNYLVKAIFEAQQRSQDAACCSSSAVHELFKCKNVKLYNIASNGEVTTDEKGSTLRILHLPHLPEANEKEQSEMFFMEISESDDKRMDTFSEMDNNNNTPKKHTAVISVNNDVTDNCLIYPLDPMTTPCLIAKDGSLIFQDFESTMNATIALVIPDESVDNALNVLKKILPGAIEDKRKITSSPRSFSDSVSKGIVKRANRLSEGLIKRSEKAGDYMTNSTTPRILSKLKRVPSLNPELSKRVARRVEKVESATSVAANVTGYVADKLINASEKMGKLLAPMVHTQGARYLAYKTGMDADMAERTVCIFV